MRVDARATRARILSAARSAGGAGRVPSLAEVARTAGVSRATVHRHFASRADLLDALDLAPDPGTAERLLEAAVAMLEETGLAGLSVESVAERASVSRAAAYRLFPGRAALFRGVVQAYAPFDDLGRLVSEMAEEPPEVVVPAILRAVAARIGPRAGLVRSVLLEFTGTQPDAEAGRAAALEGGLARVAGYLAGQMAAGRIRPMHPLLALQGLAGPLLVHVITRPQAERRFGLEMPVEEAADEFAAMWLRAMAQPGGSHAS